MIQEWKFDKNRRHYSNTNRDAVLDKSSTIFYNSYLVLYFPIRTPQCTFVQVSAHFLSLSFEFVSVYVFFLWCGLSSYVTLHFGFSVCLF